MTPREALPDDIAGESRFQLLTRLGFAARGVLYIIIAALVILTGRTEDITGALEYLNDGLGNVLLVVLACDEEQQMKTSLPGMTSLVESFRAPAATR